jgi:hypothetical protein
VRVRALARYGIVCWPWPHTGPAVTAILDRELLDFFADDRQLLALDTDGTIWCTTDLTRWSRLTTAAELHPRSLAVLDGSVYLATTDSRLYRLVGPR